MRNKIILIIIIFSFINNFLMSQTSMAIEYLRSEQPAPDSVKNLESPLDQPFRIIPRKKLLIPTLRNYIKNLPPFFSDTELYINFRTYYFDRSNPDNSESVSWAAGGSVSYESGKLFDLISIGAEVFTSQKLYGPEDKDGSRLLGPGQEGFTVVGRAYGEFNYKDKIVSKVYRQYLNSPYVNKLDVGMVPNTFEAYVLWGNLGIFKFGGGYVSRIKRRNSDEFVPMSQIEGINDTNNGMYVLGAVYEPNEEFSIGGVNYFVEDVINIFYAESYFVKTTSRGTGLKISLQVTDQRSVGDGLIGEDFNTQVWGGQIASSYANTILSLAFSATSRNRRIISPYGGYPGYISLIVDNFNRAGENAFLIGISHNFSSEVLDGLSFFANYAIGYDAINSENKESLPDQKEFNITVDYKPEISSFRGLWLRIRYANVNFDGELDSINDFRLILNYNFPLL